MKIILINHAERERDLDPIRDQQLDRHQPLKPEGEQQAHTLAERLRKDGFIPTLYLTSRNRHAKQTADIVCADLGGDPSAAVVEIDALTPSHPTETCQQILEQARSAGHDPELHDVVAVVGHYPRLNQLFAYLTWRTAAPTPLDYAQEATLTVDKFWDGRGQGQWPTPRSN